MIVLLLLCELAGACPFAFCVCVCLSVLVLLLCVFVGACPFAFVFVGDCR